MLFVDGPQALPPLALGDEGRTLLTLAPGQWTLALSSPAHGLQERLLVVDGDPSTDISLLGELANVHAVMKDGEFASNRLA